MKKVITTLALTVAAWLGFAMYYPKANTENNALPAGRLEEETQAKIQMAILFDTSNSMDGLIEQAKARIWSIVNTMSNLRHNQQIPNIEIAIYEYGNDGLSASSEHVRQILPLSTDLDLVSENLFKLTTNGGSEYCGAVISKAVNGLVWSTNPDDIRLIYIAGNEPFDQGSTDYKIACKMAADKDIKVHTIYCGDYETGKKELWYHGAQLGDGEYSNINPDQQIVHIESPYDKEINMYNDSLNGTYIYYGQKGEEFQANMIKQDANAASAGAAVNVERAATKSSANYVNESWDIVDARKHKKEFKVSEIKDEDLPEELKNKTAEEKEKYVVQKTEERKRYQEKIKDLSVKREAYVAEERKKSTDLEGADLGEQMNSSILKVAAEKGFKVQK